MKGQSLKLVQVSNVFAVVIRPCSYEYEPLIKPTVSDHFVTSERSHFDQYTTEICAGRLVILLSQGAKRFFILGKK